MDSQIQKQNSLIRKLYLDNSKFEKFFGIPNENLANIAQGVFAKFTELKTSDSKELEILALGIGTGRLEEPILNKFLENGYQINLDSCDITENLLQKLKGKKFLKRLKRNEIIQSDLTNYLNKKISSNKSYDVILCFFVLHMVPNWLEIVEKIHCVSSKHTILFLCEEAGDTCWIDNNFSKKILNEKLSSYKIKNRNFHREFWKKYHNYRLHEVYKPWDSILKASDVKVIRDCFTLLYKSSNKLEPEYWRAKNITISELISWIKNDGNNFLFPLEFSLNHNDFALIQEFTKNFDTKNLNNKIERIEGIEIYYYKNAIEFLPKNRSRIVWDSFTINNVQYFFNNPQICLQGELGSTELTLKLTLWKNFLRILSQFKLQFAYYLWDPDPQDHRKGKFIDSLPYALVNFENDQEIISYITSYYLYGKLRTPSFTLLESLIKNFNRVYSLEVKYNLKNKSDSLVLGDDKLIIQITNIGNKIINKLKLNESIECIKEFVKQYLKTKKITGTDSFLEIFEFHELSKYLDDKLTFEKKSMFDYLSELHVNFKNQFIGQISSLSEKIKTIIGENLKDKTLSTDFENMAQAIFSLSILGLYKPKASIKNVFFLPSKDLLYLEHSKNNKEFGFGGVILLFPEQDSVYYSQEELLGYVSRLIKTTSSYSIRADAIKIHADTTKESVTHHARKAANISILVDSFAHNVSAHSLTALSNYFAGRKKLLEERIIEEDLHNPNTSDLVFKKKNISKLFKTVVEEYNELSDVKFPSGENKMISISDIIKFGSKDMREELFHLKHNGKNLNLPVPIDGSVFSFINYISEKSEFWSAAIAGESFNNSITNIFELLWGFIDNPLYLGTLAASEKIHKIKFVVDNKDFTLIDFSAINATDPSANYQFIKLLKNFKDIKKSYSQKEILLPGSNVGKQSVYTIFENCLRNIKHYEISQLNEEVVFHININNKEEKYYSFEIYLGHTCYSNKKEVKDIIEVVKNQLKKGTFDDANNQPVMGGISQSILCANHLLTGKFDNEVNKKKNFEVINGDGFVKYKFKLWKGKKVKKINRETNFFNGEDNISRYKFLTVSGNDIESIRKKAGDAIRVLKSNEGDEKEVYKEWLNHWISKDNSYEWEIEANNNSCIKIGNTLHPLTFWHDIGEIGEDEKFLVFRNHGILKRNIVGKRKSGTLKYDVAEAMLTGVYTIDNRLYNVYKEKKNYEIIEDKLSLFVKEEVVTSLNNGIISIDNPHSEDLISDEINFLIIHLSFIESLNGEYKNNINKFIKKIKNATKGRENFHLVITTGRGRSDWRESIEDENKYFVKHRSVFSIQNALLEGVMKEDDFDLKFNLVKVLFGS